MTTFSAACLLVAGLLMTGCGSPAPSGTPHPVDFRGTVADAVSGLETDGYTCAVNTPSNAPSTLPPGYGSAFYALFTGECRRDAVPGQGIQGTLVSVYGLLSDGSLVGVDIRSDRLGSDPPSSPVVASALARAFAPDGAAAVQTAIRSRGAADPIWIAVSSRVSVHTEAAPLLFAISVWGPAVTAFHDALVAGPSASQ